MKITTRVALEVAHHEAVIRQAYKDSVGVTASSEQKRLAPLATQPSDACNRHLSKFRFLARRAAKAFRQVSLKRSAGYSFAPAGWPNGSCPGYIHSDCQSGLLKDRHGIRWLRPTPKTSQTLATRRRPKFPLRRTLRTDGAAYFGTALAFPSISGIAGFLTCRGFLIERLTPHYCSTRRILTSPREGLRSERHVSSRNHTSTAKLASRFLRSPFENERSSDQNADPSNLSVVGFLPC